MYTFTIVYLQNWVFFRANVFHDSNNLDNLYAWHDDHDAADDDSN